VSHDWTVFRTADAPADCLDAAFWLSPTRQTAPPPTASEVIAAAAAHWPQQWARGAALELSGSTAAGAAGLEKRVVLSQYISMSQEAGSHPPQETGLM
jgi:hypothetical protein